MQKNLLYVGAFIILVLLQIFLLTVTLSYLMVKMKLPIRKLMMVKLYLLQKFLQRVINHLH